MTFTPTLSASSEAPLDRASAINELFGTVRHPDERLTPVQLEHLSVLLAGEESLWGDLVVDSLDERWWMILHRTPNFEVKLLSWEIDQTSDWHDHGGSSGGYAVVEGSLEERYRCRAGSDLRDRMLTSGSSGCFGPAHVHDMAHRTGRPAVSIHAYSPPLTMLTTYEETPYGLTATGLRRDDTRW